MEFQFLFDGNEVSDPINWADVKIRYQRDKVTRGLLTQYSSELAFTRDGYDYIKSFFDTDPCYIIALAINYKCGQYDPFSLFLSGSIQLKDAIIDRGGCLARVIIERNEVDELFAKNKSVEVSFSNVATFSPFQLCQNDIIGPYTVLGNPTTDFATLRNWLPSVTNSPAVAPDWFEPYSGIGLSTINSSYQGACGKYVFDLFTIIVSAITDNGADFVSDHLTTRRLDQIIHVDVETSGMIAGDVIVLEFTDQLGGIQRSETTFVNAIATEVNLHQNILSVVGPTEQTVRFTGNPALVSSSLAGTIISLDINFHFPNTVSEASVSGGGSISWNETQAYQRGLSGLFIVTGASLDFYNHPELFDPSAFPVIIGNVDSLSTLSFDNLFDWLNSIENLGMSIEYNSGSGRWEVRVEPIEYFYNLVSALTINNIRNETIQFDLEQIVGGAAFGNKTEITTPYVSTGPPFWELRESTQLFKSATLNCKAILNRITETDKYSALGEKIASVITLQQTYDQDLFLIEGSGDPADTIPTAQAFRYQYSEFAGFTSGTHYYYNISLQPLASLYNWLFNLPSMDVPKEYYLHIFTSIFSHSATSTPTLGPSPIMDGYKPRIVSFTRYVKFSDFLLIQSNGLITINEGIDPADNKVAVILEIDYILATSQCKLKLLIL